MSTSRPSPEHLAAAFVQSTVGMALVGLQGQWLEVNTALCAMLGYRREKLLNLTFQEITHPEDLPEDMALVKRVLADEIASYRLEKRYRKSDGAIVWALLHVTLSRRTDGVPHCFVVQVVDITEQKRALAERDALFSLSPDLLAVSTPDGYLTQINPAWHELLGWEDARLMERPFIEMIHPDDVARTELEMRRLAGGGTVRGFRNRHRHADGSWRWIEWSTRLAADGCMFCSGRDVTGQIEGEGLLRAQEQKIRLLVEHANDAFVGMDRHGIITEWNQQAEITFGWHADEAIGQPMADLLAPPRLRQAHFDGMAAFLRSGATEARKRVEKPALRKDGSEILVEVTVGVVPVDGEPWFHAFLRDVSKQRRMSDQLHYRATHDFLTGLPNRYEFMNLLQRSLAAPGAAPALLFIDLDGFKTVNDICGHETGDTVLIEFGQRLLAVMQDKGQVARLAGDEFVALLETAEGAETLCAAILRAAAQPYPQLDGRTLLGASIGLAIADQGEGVDTLLARADAAMYAAKKAGKNRYAFGRRGEWTVRPY
jgi:diguanylate cyclase (GGDEF)-like protein/PAS domain S-box-containing protein